MPGDPFKQNFKQSLIQNLYDDFSCLSGKYWFLGIGKSTPWIDSSGITNDNVPASNLDSVKSDTDFWRTALAFKKISKDDVSLVVPRYDWEKGQVYSSYRDDVDLFDDVIPSQFYVLVDEERVYKCIDNNYGVASNVAPTHTDSQIRTLSDGYRWKYLYTITDSKRKFLTKSVVGNLGFMPVLHVDYLKENDENILQWGVQNNAVDGSIDFIQLDSSLKQYVISNKALFYDVANEIVGATSAGASQLTLGGSKIVPQNNYYTGMVLRIEAGLGIGQQRTITNYTYNSNGTALVTLDNPLNYGVTGGTGSDGSKYSILPSVTIVGDGKNAYNSLNTYSTAAEVSVKFLSQGVSGFTGQKYIDSFELINNGKNYTYADIQYGAGLTFISGISGSFGSLAKVIMSPPGGHGYNPINELGTPAIMIVTDFSGTEAGKITINNDYRQFCLVQNPILARSYAKINFGVSGLTSTFTAGNTATQGYTGANGVTGYNLASGKIISWYAGTTGYTGTSELLVSNITGGTFGIGGLINSFPITNVRYLTVAGSENSNQRRLRLSPSGSIFNPSGLDFIPNVLAIAKGNSANNTTVSNSSGKIVAWQPVSGTNVIGDLYLEYTPDTFNMGEMVYWIGNEYTGLTGPKGKIIEIDELETQIQSVYNQSLKINIKYDGVNSFTGSSFTLDSKVSAKNGSSVVGTGYVSDWSPVTGNTGGNLSLINVYGSFGIGNNIIYNNGGSSGASITSTISTPELQYRTGTILHSQNIRPITRALEQQEEIKLVIEF